MAEAIATPALQKLLAWLSPAFPVGSYAYSHGMEWAIADGTIGDRETASAWIAAVLSHGAGRNDAILLAHVWRAAAAGERAGLAELAELAAALPPSRERHLEATAQGSAFLAAVAATWPSPPLAALVAGLDDGPLAYPVAVGIAAAAHGIPLNTVLPATLSAFTATLASVAVRTIPIGQTDGQRIIAEMAPLVATIAREAEAAALDDLGGIAIRADIASMKHETQYTRLFRS